MDNELRQLPNIGEKRIKLYEKQGVSSIYSLLTYFPRTYLDFTLCVPINMTQDGVTCTCKAKVFKKIGEQRIRKGLSIFKVFVTDETEDMTITIFNSKYVYDELLIGEEYYFYGKVERRPHPQIASPIFVKAGESITMQPVYPLCEGLSSKMIQNNVKSAMRLSLHTFEDPIPYEIRQKYKLCEFSYGVQNIHFPASQYALNEARNRFIFEELLILNLSLLQLKNRNNTLTTIKIDDVTEDFIKTLPFKLTKGQQTAITECIGDMRLECPMNRLVQGDVGCGKTVVAAAICYATAKSMYQSAIMVPTEIVAKQHYATLTKLLQGSGVNVSLLIGALTKKQKDAVYAKLSSGEIDIVVGTHALIQSGVVFNNLGLVVTDEQHRFGVEQRMKLSAKGVGTHVMVMSATPIPRTLAMILYADMALSTIRELPQGRMSIETYTIGSDKRMRALAFIKKQLDNSHQGYIVCSMIEDTNDELASVISYVEQVKKTPLGEYNIAFIHGKLKPSEKEQIMRQFCDNEIQLLISTTVVEVGLDVPNATIMLVENAERFGLSQLHQLRGRVGRGEYQSYCILLSDNQGEENKLRLKVMCDTNDGFLIAEEDLKLRGAGDFFGKRQHGVVELKIANIFDDIEVLQLTRDVAVELVEHLDEYETLKSRVHNCLELE